MTKERDTFDEIVRQLNSAPVRRIVLVAEPDAFVLEAKEIMVRARPEPASAVA